MAEADPPTDHEITLRIREAIEAGDLLRDGRLPSERDLAQRFGISRARLRRVLDLLQEDGVIFRRHGHGTFALPPPAYDAGRLRVLANRVTPREVMEVRLEVEPALAALAASRAQPEDLRVLTQMMQATLDVRDTATYDAADDIFHYKIAETARNPLFLTVYDAIRTVRKQASWTRSRKDSYRPETLHGLGLQHRTLVEAIGDGDARAAADSMELHLLTVSRTLLHDEAAEVEIPTSSSPESEA